MISNTEADFWNEGLKLISYCPVCEARYSSLEMKVLHTESETRLIHITCRKCKHSILAFIVMNQAGASSMGLLTDLTYEDALSLRASRVVDIDDVLQTHSFLSEVGWEDRLGIQSKEQLQEVRKKHRSCEMKTQKNKAAR